VIQYGKDGEQRATVVITAAIAATAVCRRYGWV
jgi:hypothetical protein